ncbi:PREDICTED: uncharacterized protein LOC105971926 isoform X1 [Erythranthe guttata]|uniref:uncharacterized protein LOC105971926 isoform X1 n=2 Tax=Erythranthe guttata TaxID=4155 RepID=UPI00064DAB88|nr:PREDICTED: uncharacterized protein LOC105971926 isoform X1 [Erythranthe guttata]|eukprot:XP_012852313.1 PREDICTED: uncharacterized protein LOC105971926 isoform X1 [Erythranthe guttata]
MTSEGEDRSLVEPLGLEGTEDEFSKGGKLKIKYVRDLLLKFIEVEVCRKLPRDFDPLILSDLGGESDDAMEHGRLSGKPSPCDPLPSTRSWLGFPSEKMEDNQSKRSHWLGDCSSAMSDAVCQQVPPRSRYFAEILSQPIQKDDLNQLKKSENPYLPPHLNKKMQKTLDTSSELGSESSEYSSSPNDSITESDKSGYRFPLARVDDSLKMQETLDTSSELGAQSSEDSSSPNDSITESDKSGYRFPFARVDDSLKMQETLDTSSELGAESSEDSSSLPNESNHRAPAISTTDNEKSGTGFTLAGIDDSVKMQEILDPSSEHGARSSEGSSFSPIESNQSGSVDSITENDKSGYGFPLAGVDYSAKTLFGEFEATWVDSDGRGTVDCNNELVLGILENDEFIYDKYWDEILDIIELQLEPERLPSPTPENKPDSEVKKLFSDEDSSIPLDHSTLPASLNLDSSNNTSSETEIIWPDEDSLILISTDKVTSNKAVNMGKNSVSPNFTKSGDKSTSHGCNAQSLHNFSASATQGKPYPQQSYSRRFTEMFGPEMPLPCLPKNFRPKSMLRSTFPFTSNHNRYGYPNFPFQSFQENNFTNTKANDPFVQYSLLHQPKPEMNTKQFSSWPPQRAIYHGFGN